MPKTFELTFTKIADNLYSGYLSVEGRQMTFGVPKTKEEIYQFLFGGTSTPAPPPVPEPEVQPAPLPLLSPIAVPSPYPVAGEGWRYVPLERSAGVPPAS